MKKVKVYAAEVTLPVQISGVTPKPFTVNVWSSSKLEAIRRLKRNYAKVENVRCDNRFQPLIIP